MKKPVSAEQFIRIWQGAKSRQEVVKKTRLTPGQASIRACRYRKQHKVPLKFLDPNKAGKQENGVDWSAMAKLARSLNTNGKAAK